MFGNKTKKDKRFKIIHEESTAMIGCSIIQDTKTGVNYLLTQGVSSGGLTPLLDIEGKPLVTPTEIFDEQ